MYREDGPSTLSAGAEQIMKNLEYFIGVAQHLNSIFQISLTSLRPRCEGSERTVAVSNVNQLIPIAKTTTTHAKVHKDFLRLLVVTAIISATYSVHCTPYRITCLRKIVTNSDQNNEKKEFNYLYSIFAVFHLYFGLYTNRMCISNT